MFCEFVFHSFSVSVPLDKVAEINYALLRAPNFTANYIETDHKVSCENMLCCVLHLMMCNHSCTYMYTALVRRFDHNLFFAHS